MAASRVVLLPFIHSRPRYFGTDDEPCSGAVPTRSLRLGLRHLVAALAGRRFWNYQILEDIAAEQRCSRPTRS